MPKEQIELASGGLSMRIDDFKTLSVFGKKARHTKAAKQDKGHAAEMRALANAIKTGAAFPISVNESLDATLATFALVESIRRGGERIDLEGFQEKWISATSN
jgi:hypothetical protein